MKQFIAFKLPVYSNFSKFDTTTMRLVTDNQKIFDVPFAIGVSLFLLISALFHFLIIMPKVNDV